MKPGEQLRIRAENRLKVKEYKYERDALKEFLDVYGGVTSPHVFSAISSRLRLVEREINILTGTKEPKGERMFGSGHPYN